jgi:O-antigen ligase
VPPEAAASHPPELAVRPLRLLHPAVLIAVLTLSLVPLGSASPQGRNFAVLVVSLVFLFALIRILVRRSFAQVLLVQLGAPHPLLLAIPLVPLGQAILFSTVASTGAPLHALWQSVWLMTSIALYYVMAHATATDLRGVKWLLGGLVVLMSAEAFYGILNLLSGNEYLLIYRRWAYPESATGTVVARSHFAFLMEMGVPIGAAFAVLFSHDALRSGDKASEESARRAFVGAGVAAMVLALLLSRSRLGVLALLAASAIVLGLDRMLRASRRVSEKRGKSRRMSVLLLATALAALVAAAFIGLEPLIERFGRVSTDFRNGRLPLWSAAATMFADRPLVGHGWGAYGNLLSSYRSEPTGFMYLHAHNEYLEVAADAGIVGLIVLMVFLALFVRRLVTALLTPMSEEAHSVVIGLGIAMTSVFIHSVADFGLRVPGIAFTFATVTALFLRVTATPDIFERGSHSRRRRSRSGHRSKGRRR